MLMKVGMATTEVAAADRPRVWQICPLSLSTRRYSMRRRTQKTATEPPPLSRMRSTLRGSSDEQVD